MINFKQMLVGLGIVAATGFHFYAVNSYDKKHKSPTTLNYSGKKLRKNLTKKKYKPNFLYKLEDICKKHEIHCPSLLSIIDYETIGTFRPDIQNKHNKATGLLQFTRTTAKSLGTSIEELKEMTNLEQLDYVDKYFSRFSHVDLREPKNVALAVFYPAAIGKDDDYVIGNKNSKGLKGLIYRQNKTLDTNKDGIITAKEYVEPALNRRYTIKR